jgi:NitT/TauT family transport system substrate-binding protein
MNILQHITRLYLVFLVVMLSACSEEIDPPMRLGANVWIGYEPLFLAQHQAYINPESIRLVEFLSASEVIRAFRNQALEAAAVTLDEALLLVESNIPIQIILVTDVSAGADAIISKPEIKSFDELLGKRIGVESSAVGAYMLSRALEINNLKHEQIVIVNLPVNEHENAYVNHKVDALVTFEPTRSKLLAMGANELFTSRELPNEIIDVIVVRSDYLDMHRDKLKGLINAWFRTIEYLREYPKDAANIMSQRMHVSSDDLLASYAGIHFPDKQENITLLGGDAQKLKSIVHKLQHSMKSHHLLEINKMGSGLFGPSVMELYTQ